jgi:hypothetical protein
LNQALPNAVHLLALKTYGLIFKHHCSVSLAAQGVPGNGEASRAPSWGNSLAYYSPGLFSFYQFAKLDVKLAFNALIKEYYLQLGTELLSCLNGLVSILLFGLDDPNEDAQRSIDEILQELERKAGTRFFYGSVWLVSLLTLISALGTRSHSQDPLPDLALHHEDHTQRSRAEQPASGVHQRAALQSVQL